MLTSDVSFRRGKLFWQISDLALFLDSILPNSEEGQEDGKGRRSSFSVVSVGSTDPKCIAQPLSVFLLLAASLL